MVTRILAIIILSVAPLGVLADDTTVPAASQESAQPSGTDPAAVSSPNVTGPGSIGPDLGPPTAASSPGDGASLQPVGNNPLQSGNTDSGGLTAPMSQDLQGAAPSGDLKVLLGDEADGGTRTLAAPTSGSGTVLDTLALLLAVGLIVMIVVLRRRAEATPAS